MAPAVNTDGDLTMGGQQIEELLATEVAEKIEGKEETTEKKEDAHDDGEKVANGEDPIANGQLEPTVKQIADWSKCPAKGTEKCWNPRCFRSAVVDSTYKSRKCCGMCLEQFYSQLGCFCPGCGLGYEVDEPPADESDPFMGCAGCDTWVHRKCEDPSLRIGVYDTEFLMVNYYCFDCRASMDCEIEWRYPRDLLLESQRDGEEGVLILKRPLLCCGARKNVSYPIIIVGFDFRHDRDDKRVVIAMAATRLQNEKLEWERLHFAASSTKQLLGWDEIMARKHYSKPRGVWAMARSLFADPDVPVLEVLPEDAKSQYHNIREELEDWQKEYDHLVATVGCDGQISSDDEAKHKVKRRKVESSRGLGRPRKADKATERPFKGSDSWAAARGRLGNCGPMRNFTAMLLEAPQTRATEGDDEEVETALKAPSVVWARIPVRGPSWTPAVLTHVLKGEAITAPYMVYFLEREQLPVAHLRPSQSASSVVGDASTVSESGAEGSVKETSSEPTVSAEEKSVENMSVTDEISVTSKQLATRDEHGRPISEWLRELMARRLTSDERDRAPKFSWLERNAIQPWNCPRKQDYEKIIHRAPPHKKRSLSDAVLFGDAFHSGEFDDREGKGLPSHIFKEYLRQQKHQAHIEAQNKSMVLSERFYVETFTKKYLELSLLELQCRCLGRARQFVKAVEDEHYGGWHLIAAQDWPTDDQIRQGLEEDVILVYAGSVLTREEAMQMEASSENVHTDDNRAQYADPTSKMWSIGPTVNHERVEYCKLEPRHCEVRLSRSSSGHSSDEGQLLRGFWLQRKRGEIITEGEPLFWSYDGGAGKFDRDFNLIGAPPPQGWISTEEIKSKRRRRGFARSMPSKFSKWVPLAPENQLNLRLTLFSGQVFVWKALDGGQEGELYCGVIGSTAFRLRTNAELAMIEYSCWPSKQIEKAGVQLRQFFQLETDIDALYKDWEGRDEVFRAVVHNKNLRGLRVVHQDPFECLVSFITSQNNNVKRISLLLNALRQRYGTHLATATGADHEGGEETLELYQFPSLQQLHAATEDDFREMGFGYRARYLRSLITALQDEGQLEKLRALDAFKQETECREFLTSFMGVGRKVADCVALFSMRGRQIIPCDVHVIRLAYRHYMGSKKPPTAVTEAVHEEINTTLRSILGEFAGWAHSILFTAELMANPRAEANKTPKEAVPQKKGVKRRRRQ
ncbi:8-oxoguanine glycosylase ogg1 [Perkinsus olseni]|uniref:DNA-(apurinic or apyrimidinic site) lyase n=1 Tax=Perkinsus olseni TaxID=32597 RepID=A0A7J6P6A1_PEROL|nr:8-oxoguanine glycosylase ogg1 [Perkinsus olseni]